MPTTRKPDVIVREIEQTRAELADAIDAITDRINPRRAAARGARAMRDAGTTSHTSGISAIPGSRPAVLAMGAVIAVIALMLIKRRH